MLRMFRAFAWIRWRMLINSLEKTGSRDVLERFSLAAEKLGPLIAILLLAPSALFLFALGVAAGYTLGQDGAASLPLEAARYLLLAVPVLAVFGPLVLPAADRTNPVRLLLLPIPPSTLYVAQSATALGDVWNLLMVPLVAGIPLGLLVSGALLPALGALLAAVLLVLVIVGLASLATSVLHLVVRDRRRGELVALLFIVLIPVVSMLPGLLTGSQRHRSQPREPLAPAWMSDAAARASALYPTEQFVRAVRESAAGRPAVAGRAIAGLAAGAVVLHGLGLLVFRRVLEQPGSTGPRRAASAPAAWGRRLPGLSPAESAVAMAQLRLALRTPRGRSILLSPIAVLALFAVMMYRGGGTMDFGPFRLPGGIGLASFTCFVSLMSILPIAMNQFAVDRAGLTMALLSPLTEEELLRGKAAGNAMIAAPPVLVSMAAALAFFPGGSAYVWMALPLGMVAIYFIVAPLAAICSAVFPRAVDMNSIGRGSNAHGAAGFIGMFAFVGAGVPPMLLTVLATRVFARPWLAPVLVLLWCAVAYVIGRVLFVMARRVVAARRENLAMVV